MIASVPDLLRLLAVPFFGYLAWRDVKTRRVPNRTWYPIAALALVLLAWELYVMLIGDDVIPFYRRQFLLQVALSVGIVVPLAYAFWAIGGFGGADAKAFFVVAILFPTYPTYTLWQYGWLPVDALPLVETTVGVLSLTILSNTVIAGLAYPLVLAARNAVAGHRSPGMFVAKPIRWDRATEEYGSILRFLDRSILADLSPSGLRSYFAWRSLDLDALRMYLQWRDISLAELRDDATTLRDPETLPAEPAHPGDGSIATDGGELDDPWGAEAFLADIQGSAYGTTPDELREGLDLLTSEDVVWISPGIPFLVPLFGGLVLALTYGDVLFALMETIGLV